MNAIRRLAAVLLLTAGPLAYLVVETAGWYRPKPSPTDPPQARRR